MSLLLRSQDPSPCGPPLESNTRKEIAMNLRSGRRRWFPLVASLALLLGGSILLAGEPQETSWKGFLIDRLCASERLSREPGFAPTHTRKCLLMPACQAAGYALLADDNKLLTFDEHGNQLARALIEARHGNRDDNWKVHV